MHVDPRSDTIVLRYVGDGRPISGVPARDLSEHDLARLAHRRALAAIAGDVGRPVDPTDPGAGVFVRPDPAEPDQALVAVIHDELIARGQFEPAKAAKADRAAKADNETPAMPVKKEA